MAMHLQKSGWFKRHKHKIGLIAVGHTAKKIEEHIVDWLIYGVVVTYCTITWGGFYGSLAAFAIMTPVTAALCYLYIRLYDWAGIDWLGLEALKELREENGSGFFAKIIYRIAHHGGVLAFVALSIYGDAFMTTVYFRHGSRAYRGLTRRDWVVFLGSVVVSNAYWTLRWAVIVELALYAWNLIRHL